LAVDRVGGPVGVAPDSVVDVPDRRVAPGGLAHLVAQPDEPGQRAQEPPPVRVGGHELAGLRMCVEPAEPDALSAGAGFHHHLAGELGRDRSEGVQVGRLVAATEEVVVGHHQVQGDR
jgi:hypothetical protein